MKKLLAVLLSAAMVMSLAACAQKQEQPAAAPATAAPQETTVAATVAATQAAAAEAAKESGDHSTEIALVMSAEGTIDDRGFFQGAWEGITKFCEETGYSCGYYNPTDNTADALYEVMDLAVLNGVKVFVIAGTNFIGMMEEIFAAYPDCYFICNDLQDSTPDKNSVIYLYKAEEATFLCGVAAVYENYKDMGVICGMQIPSNLNGGYGFMQGISYGVEKLDAKDVSLKYWYTNTFDPSADIQAYAAAWFQGNTEMIAAFCGPAETSIYAAAEANNGKTMGADVDKSGYSDTVITTFLKNVNVMTYTGLKSWSEGKPEQGIKEVGIKEGAVGIVMDKARFNNFTQKDLDEVIDKINSGEITIQNYTAADRPDDFFNQMEKQNYKFEYFE